MATHVAIDPKWADCEGCNCIDGVAGYERWELVGIIKTRHCPRRLVTQDSAAWIGLFTHYKAGHLAYAGGALDQPNKYLDAMKIIDQQVNSRHG